MNLWWQQSKGYPPFSWAGPVVLWIIKLCLVCGQGKYASTEAFTFFVRGSKSWKTRSRLAKRGEDGQWFGFRKGTQAYDLPLRVEGSKPELPCECISKSGRIPKRIIDRYLLPPTPAPRHPNIYKVKGTLPDSFADGFADTDLIVPGSTVDTGTSRDRSAGRSRGKSTDRPRRQFLPFSESSHGAAARAMAAEELAEITARLEAEEQERLANDNDHHGTR